MKLPTPPKTLSKTSAAFFTKFVSDYESVDDAELAVLEKVCSMMDRAAEAAAGIKKQGMLTPDRFGIDRANPLIAVERMATLAIVNGLKALGVLGGKNDVPDRYEGKVF
jgi:phage terminase small subunit